MTEYLIDYLTSETPDSYGSNSRSVFHFKIHNNGNVDVFSRSCSRDTIYPFNNQLTIHDNIPIPLYLIDMLKKLIEIDYRYSGIKFAEYYYLITETIRLIKTKLAEVVNNPENKEELQLQIKFMLKKEELNKIEFDEMNQKHVKNIKNIQKYNEKLKEENHQLREEKNKSDEWRKNYNELYKNISEVQVERDKLKKENIELTQLRKENVELQKLREDNHKLLKENYNLYKDLNNLINKR
jgi:hypothetical protein